MKITDLLKEDKNIKVGDVVVLEFDDIVVEASVIETEDNNIVLEFDEFAMTVLENFNSLTEDESYGELVQIDEDWIPLAEPSGNYKHDPKDRGTPVHGPIPTNRPQQTSPAKKAPQPTQNTKSQPPAPSKKAPQSKEPLGTIRGGVWTATPPKKGEVGVPTPSALDEFDNGGGSGGSWATPKKEKSTEWGGSGGSWTTPTYQLPLPSLPTVSRKNQPENSANIAAAQRALRNKTGNLDEAEYQGRKVPLGKPMKGDVKKSKVYVKGPKGNVVKVNFGDKNMKIKKNIPGRRKSFRARHNCANPGPRWKARFWSCRAW